ncbi:hypothetical protein HF886_01840 [Rhodococcus sp. 105337]|nr:hypothetical protein [Rhodococcus sp. 105337]
MTAVPDPTEVLEEIATQSPYFAVGTGPAPGPWQPTTALRECAIRDALVSTTADRMVTSEPRVAASTVFFGYAARMWSVALGSVTTSGRCIRLDPGMLLWRTDGGMQLHLADPRFGGSVAAEVLDAQLEPLIEAWADVVAPGLMWGNTASALIGAGRVLGPAATPYVEALLGDPRLRTALDRSTHRRRSCCLFYRTPNGGVCGDCPFPTPPAMSSKERS